MLTRLLLGAFGLLGVLHGGNRLLSAEETLLTELPGIAIGMLICIPLIVCAALGEQRFVRRFPIFAGLFADRDAGEKKDDDTTEEHGSQGS